MSLEWWQVPEMRADLEHALTGLNALRFAVPEGNTAYFCDVCEALIGLLNTGARCAVTPEEDLAVRELRTRLDRQLESTVYVSPAAIETIVALEESIIAALLAEPERKLAVYGTLAPGEVNHSQIAHLDGPWSEGFIRGDLRVTGWGSEYGFPALTWRPDGPEVPVKLLTCHDLAGEWRRLDKFEGAGYCRILVPIEDDSGVVAVANLYAERSPGEASPL